jgi:hypothetical protein
LGALVATAAALDALMPGQAVGVQPLVDLLRALAEALDQCPVVQPLDLGRA